MTEAINLYGDRLVPTTGQHGSNVSSQRIDELDTACLDFIRQRIARGDKPNAIDIGGGNGARRGAWLSSVPMSPSSI